MVTVFSYLWKLFMPMLLFVFSFVHLVIDRKVLDYYTWHVLFFSPLLCCMYNLYIYIINIIIKMKEKNFFNISI